MVRTVPFIERRRYQRTDAAGAAFALLLDRRHDSLLARLSLRDLSDGGLSATSPVALPVARTVTVSLPSEGVTEQAGRVVRCRRQGRDFDIAVAFATYPTIAG